MRASPGCSGVRQPLNCQKIVTAYVQPHIGGFSFILYNTTGSCLGSGKIFLDDFADTIVFDTLGDSLGIIMTDGDGHVSNIYEDEAYVQNNLVRVQQWDEKGYLWPEVFNAGLGADESMAMGYVFATLQASEYGVEASKEANTGIDLTVVPVASSSLDSSMVAKHGCVVPYTAEEPEAAVRFLNLCYTNSEVMNLMNWGVEGTDYVVQDGEACYPQGKGADNMELYRSYDYIFGNQFLSLPWQGSGADFRQQAETHTKGIAVSPYLGFSLNSEGMDNLIAGISGVYYQYVYTFYWGDYSEAEYASFLEKLRAAGVDDYVAEFQTQLDAWLAAR